MWGHYGYLRSLGGMWGCHRAIWGHKGGDQEGYLGDMGLQWGYWGIMGSLRGILKGYLGDIWVAVGSLWGCKAIRRDVGLS